jgi:hypothetical protein
VSETTPEPVNEDEPKPVKKTAPKPPKTSTETTRARAVVLEKMRQAGK